MTGIHRGLRTADSDPLRRAPRWGVVVLAIAACGPANDLPRPADMARDASGIIFFPDVPGERPVEGGDMATSPPEARRRIDLRAALGESDVEVVGVVVAADGKRYLLEATRGIYQLDGDGKATRIWNPLDKGIATGPFLDMVALGRTTFGVAQKNEGYLVDPASGRVVRHFCYLPSGVSLYGGRLPPDGDQVTDALAMASPAPGGGAARIVAQPITYNRVGRAPIASHLAIFDAASGDSLLWLEFDQGLGEGLFHSRAMTWEGSRLLVVADKSTWFGRVFEIHLDEQFMSPVQSPWSLTLGDTRIEAIAYDGVQGSFLIVDGDRDQLLEMDQGDVY